MSEHRINQMKQQLTPTLPLAMALAMASAAGASVAPTMTLPQQAQKAEVIVRGELGAPQTVTNGGVTWRAYPLTVTEVVSGDVNRLPQLEGQPTLYIWANAEGLPEWRTRQDAFFLLYTAQLDSPLVGFNQGYYAINAEQIKLADKDITVDAFRQQLLEARGEKTAPAATPEVTPTEPAVESTPAPTPTPETAPTTEPETAPTTEPATVPTTEQPTNATEPAGGTQ